MKNYSLQFQSNIPIIKNTTEITIEQELEKMLKEEEEQKAKKAQAQAQAKKQKSGSNIGAFGELDLKLLELILESNVLSSDGSDYSSDFDSHIEELAPKIIAQSGKQPPLKLNTIQEVSHNSSSDQNVQANPKPQKDKKDIHKLIDKLSNAFKESLIGLVNNKKNQ